MPYAVCTLFEKNYHYGVAALVNSLYKKGFRGAVYAGYRGALPNWCKDAREDLSLNWDGAKTFDVAEGLQIHFLPIKNDYNLSNYKPDFMLQLFEGSAKDKTGLAYFDPDIVIKCSWDFFEKWMSMGVALIHDITHNDMPLTHPIRKGWEEIIRDSSREVTNDILSYINAGFCGVEKANLEFIRIWSEFVDLAIKKYAFDGTRFRSLPKSHIFFSGDQDALNIAAMCSGCAISEAGPEAMDFIPGGWLMSHAVGKLKPWSKNFISWSFKGRPPTLAERGYWMNVINPIQIYPMSRVKFKIRCLKIASIIGRFYRRY